MISDKILKKYIWKRIKKKGEKKTVIIYKCPKCDEPCQYPESFRAHLVEDCPDYWKYSNETLTS